METSSTPKPPKLLEQVAIKMRTLHYSIRTESAYIDWIKRFILFHNKRHPREMGGPEAEWSWPLRYGRKGQPRRW